MIKKTLITTLCLIALYALFKNLFLSDVRLAQSDWQIGQYYAQEYLYSDFSPKAVLTGSSVSFGFTSIQEDEENYYSITCAGENSLKGLKVLNIKGVQSGFYPDYVLIEAPTLTAGETMFDMILYNPFLFHIRRYVPIFRDARQPLLWVAARLNRILPKYVIPYQYSAGNNIIGPKLNQIKTYYNKHSKASTSNKEQNKIQEIKEENIFSNLNYNTSTPLQLLDNDKHLLLQTEITSLVDSLIAHGTVPIFFFPPSQKAYKTPKYNSIISILDEFYPADKYPHVINHPDSNFLNSGDGIHMPDNRFERYLKQKVDSIIQQ